MVAPVLALVGVEAEEAGLVVGAVRVLATTLRLGAVPVRCVSQRRQMHQVRAA